MRRVRQSLGILLTRFRRVEDGTAAVEFALVLPIMLMLYIGSVEVSLLISMDRKLQSVAGALGDLVARSDGSISAGTLDDYFKAAAGIMTPHSTDELKQVVTQVKLTDTGIATVVWSREYSGGDVSVGTKYLDGEEIENFPAAMKAVAGDNYVIIAEGSYAYPPLYGFAFKSTVNLYRQNYFMPRFGERIDIE
ncbi:MAG TPA: TadE/TadG family type IV pilus assembly protein [Devosia sp.]|jgi:Flp pilus assembly protein TadG|nr:TadE/TadG family type IV pilus assembly protein [Devosia sp.]